MSLNYEKLIDETSKQITKYQKKITKLQNKLIDYQKQIEKDKKEFDFKLNPSQKKAVDYIHGNNIIIACPGSGKTHTLIAKIAYLVNKHNVDPESIILITFTKKASQEMNLRLAKHLGRKQLLHTGTIHGLAYRVLQKYNNINYTIVDEYDAYKYLKQCVGEYTKKLSDEEQCLLDRTIIEVYEQLSANYPASLDNVLSKLNLLNFKEEITNGLKSYDNFKEKHNYLDFNDLMIKFLEFLKSDRSVEFIDKIKHILFDEYQDVNSIQNSIVSLMNKPGNLTVVGDDAQSIYAFRGSDNKFILNFKSNYDNVEQFFLESNYRSTKSIVNMCNDIISHNNNQYNKKMVSMNSVGTKPKIIGLETTDDEIVYVVNSILYNKAKLGVAYKDQVIITRKNRQLDQYELFLIEKNIPYVKTKGVGLLDRVHIKDFLAFLVILVNNKSIIHWKRILKILEGVGDVTAQKILNTNDIYDTVVKSRDNKITVLGKMFKKVENASLADKLNHIIKFLEPYILKSTKLKDKYNVEDKIDDLKTLTVHITRTGSITKFLEDIHLNIEVEDKIKQDSKEDYLLLSTIHGSKGLEWSHVYLSGCSSDLIPSYRPNLYTDEMDNIEEERRLFYVGCSRAKVSLEITLTYDYHFVDSSVYASPFLKELDENLYHGVNLYHPEKLKRGCVTDIVTNYLLLKSSSTLYQYLSRLKYTKKVHYSNSYTKNIFFKNRCEKIYGSFIDNLIVKMIHQKHRDVMDDLELPIYEKKNFVKDTHYHKFIDAKSDWKDIVASIMKVSLKGCWTKVKHNTLIEWATTKESFELYKNIEIAIGEITTDNLKCSGEKCPDQIINPHMNISFGDIYGEADAVVGRTILEFKTSKDTIATTRNVLQTIMYRYMLRKKNIRIDKIVLFNPLLGESYTLHVVPDWKDTFRVWNRLLK